MKKITITLLMIILVILSVSSISAYQRLCLGYGETIPSEENPIYTCWHDLCQVCVTNNLYPAAPYKCNDIQGCETLGNGTNIDNEPPNLTVNSPAEDGVYDSTSVLMDLETDEPASFYYIDNINGRGRWSRLSSNTNKYSRKLRFNEGLNDITIKAKDRNGNYIEVQRIFRVDSKKPKITKTFPKSGFVNTIFEVQFKEENPESLILHYITTEEKTAEVDLINDCTYGKGKYSCNIDVDLEDYNGPIEYWFILTDIADSVDESKHVFVEVDTEPPDLNNPNEEPCQENSFWCQGEGKKNKYIYFNFDITESNFDEVTYSYTDSRGRIKEKRLCSRLKDGVCEKKSSFRKGHHVLDIQIKDEAGNSIGKSIEFDVV